MTGEKIKAENMTERGHSHQAMAKRDTINTRVSSEIFRGRRIRNWILPILIAGSLLPLACTRRPSYPEPLRIGQDVSIDVPALEKNIPSFFSYHYQGKNINFFVIKADDSILSFFDVCRECYPKKMGFRFDKGFIACKACDERYPLSDIGTGVGNCYPIKLTGKEKDGKYLIPVSSLISMAGKF